MPELSSKIKKELRDYYGFETIKDAYSIFGVNNANDAYKALNKEFINEQKRTLKEQAKENAKKFVAEQAKIQKKKEEDKKKRKEEKSYTTLYSNDIRIETEYDFKGINYKINEIELNNMKRKVKKQNALFQQEISFHDNNGKLINNIVKVKGQDNEGNEVWIYYDFKTMKFETNTINKEFINKINMNMVNEKDYSEWKPDVLLFVYPNGYTKIITKALNPIKSTSKKQTYRDNNTGTCVYDGAVNFFQQLSEKNKNAKSIYNKLIKNKDTLAKKYTDETIETELAPFCNASITIKNLINGKDKKFNENTFNRFNIEFMNTKYNHLDLLAHNYNEIEEVSKEEMKSLKEKLPFYIDKYGTLITLDKTYKQIDSEFQIIYKDWKKSNAYDNYFIYKDTDEYKMINRYDYKLHTFFNAFEKDNSLYKEIDLKKAYYNYSDINMNTHYKGVPSGSFLNVSCDETFDFKKITENGLIGFYEIKIIDSKLDERLGLTNGSIHYLFTSMIELLLDNNVKIQFLNASYSPSVHIQFTKEFLNTENDLKHYCKAYGLMLSENSVIDMKVKPLKCDKDYFETINDTNLHMYQDGNMIKLQYQNKKVKCYTHIAYAIHAYTQTLILEQLLDMDLDYVFGVKLDSIVYKKEYPVEYNTTIFTEDKKCKIEGLLKHTSFEDEDDEYLEELNYMKQNIKTKEDEEFYNECLQDHKASGYNRKYIVPSNTNNLNFPLPFTQTGEYIVNRVVFFGGAGGTGKTFSCLNNLDVNTTCYTTMCWNLIQGKMEEYKGTHGHSIPQLTGGSENFKCEKTTDKNIKHIIIDEATLLNYNNIEQIIKDYPHSFIFILGDVDEDGFYYQASVTKKVINPSLYDMQYIKYLKTFRFDENLNNKLNILRDVMKKEKKISKYYHITKILECVKEQFADNFMKIEDVKFNDIDIGICAKDDFKRENELTNYFIEKGTTPQYFIKKTIKEKNQMRGQQLKELPCHNNYECKLFKTIHSFQGLDLSHDNKIIIVVDSLFDENLLYTALSRARRQDQIILIEAF
jgi:hypothetical protein